MPAAIRYIPPTDREREGYNQAVESERQQRRDKYREALKYYEGDQEEQLEYNLAEDPNDNVFINLVKMTADRTISFLFPEVPKFETDPKSIEDTEEEQWIKKFIEANGGLHALVKLGLRGFLAGHAFIRVKPVPERYKSQPDRYPSMTVLDPTAVVAFWRADDVGDILWYELRYKAGTQTVIQDFIKSETEPDVWRIRTFKSAPLNDQQVTFSGSTVHGEMRDMEVMGDYTSSMVFKEEGKPAIHKNVIPPIIEFPHLPHPDDYYGMGEFGQKDLQDTINRIASERNRIVRENSDPVDVLTGADAEDVDSEGGLLAIASPGAKVTRLEMKGDLEGINTTQDKLIETYLAIARVVLLKGEAKDLQRVTNASVRTLFLDALAKNNLLQSTYGSGLVKVIKLAMAMAFIDGKVKVNPANLNVTIKFQTPLPIDLTEIANQNAIMVNMGARSLRTASTHMGDDWDFEVAAMESEQTVKEERMVREGEIAATNAKAMSDVLPAPVAPAGGKPPPGKPVPKPVSKK